MAGCQGPEPSEEPPPALAHALGTRPGAPAATPDDPRELWTCDLGPFFEAGLRGWEFVHLVEQLLEARAAATDERKPVVGIGPSGHVLRVRAERSSLALAKGLVARLRAEKTQPIRMDVHLLEVASERLAFLDGERPGAIPEGFMKQLGV